MSLHLLQQDPPVAGVKAVVQVHYQVAPLLGGEGDVRQNLPGGMDYCLTATPDPHPELEGCEVSSSFCGHLGSEGLGTERAQHLPNCDWPDAALLLEGGKKVSVAEVWGVV